MRKLKLANKGNKKNEELLAKQKAFPEITCIKELYQPRLPEDEEKKMIAYREEHNMEPYKLPQWLAIGDKCRIFRTVEKTDEDNELSSKGDRLYYILGTKTGQLFMTEREVEHYFDWQNDVVAKGFDWMNVPFTNLRFSMPKDK